MTRISDALAKSARDLLICDHHLALWREHRTAPLDVPSTHFKADSQPWGVRLRANPDIELPLRMLRTVRVPGDHFSMLTDRNAEGLGARLAQVLDAADKRIGKRPGGALRHEREEASVRAFLTRFVDSMQARDGVALASMFAPDERTSLIGIGDTVLLGAERISRRYMRSTAAVSELRAQLHEPHIFVLGGGQSACVTARLDSNQQYQEDGYQASHPKTRLSMVLEKQGDSWWIVQLHYSDPREHELLER